MIETFRKKALRWLSLGLLAAAGCSAPTVKQEEFLAYKKDSERTISTLKEQIAEAQKKALDSSHLRYETILRQIEIVNARLSVATLESLPASALEEQDTKNALQYLKLVREIAALYKKEWDLGDTTSREIAKLRIETKDTDNSLTAKIADLKKLFEDSQKEYETFKNEALKGAPEKTNAETYKCPLSYENPLVAQMLPGIIKAAYQRAAQSNQRKDWIIYEVGARFFIDQNIDVAPHDGTISKAKFKKFLGEHPDLELVVSSDKIADEFRIEFPTESYKAKWREIRAKINRVADIEQKARWSDVEFVRYALMPGMQKTPDGKAYFISKAYSDYFEGRVNSGIEGLESKK